MIGFVSEGNFENTKTERIARPCQAATLSRLRTWAGRSKHCALLCSSLQESTPRTMCHFMGCSMPVCARRPRKSVEDEAANVLVQPFGGTSSPQECFERRQHSNSALRLGPSLRASCAPSQRCSGQRSGYHQPACKAFCSMGSRLANAANATQGDSWQEALSATRSLGPDLGTT